MDNTVARLRAFLAQRGLHAPKKRDDIKQALSDAAGTKKLPLAALATFLDELAPHSRQHAILMKSTVGMASEWRREHQRRVDGLNSRVTGKLGDVVILPEKPSISKVEMVGNTSLRVQVVSVETGLYRAEELDYEKEISGELHSFKAYKEETARSVTIFSWNLVSGDAVMQMTQLPSAVGYEEIEKQAQQVLAPDLHLEHFVKLDTGKAIKRLHENAQTQRPDVRPQSIDYASPRGRHLVGRVSGLGQSLVGEILVDGAMDAMRNHGVGRVGNFYWLPSSTNPLSEEVHVVILAEHNRINFTIDNDSEIIRHILERIRGLAV